MKKEYRFYGWQSADVRPVNEEYAVIKDPRIMYDILSEVWCKETCAARMRDKWTKDNMTWGQCSITAFLAQDIFGGKVYGVPRANGHFHCYNEVDGCIFDLTSEQFGDEGLIYEGNPEQFREDHFKLDDKEERYQFLKSEFDKKVKKMMLLTLIDAAAKGNIEAAEKIALGYYHGDFGGSNLAKAKKWASYAARHGSRKAEDLLLMINT